MFYFTPLFLFPIPPKKTNPTSHGFSCRENSRGPELSQPWKKLGSATVALSAMKGHGMSCANVVRCRCVRKTIDEMVDSCSLSGRYGGWDFSLGGSWRKLENWIEQKWTNLVKNNNLFHHAWRHKHNLSGKSCYQCHFKGAFHHHYFDAHIYIYLFLKIATRNKYTYIINHCIYTCGMSVICCDGKFPINRWIWGRCFEFCMIGSDWNHLNNSIITAGKQILEKTYRNSEWFDTISLLSSGCEDNKATSSRLKLPLEIHLQYVVCSKLKLLGAATHSALWKQGASLDLIKTTVKVTFHALSPINHFLPSFPRVSVLGEETPYRGTLACIQCSHCSPPSCSPIQCTFCRKGKSGAVVWEGKYRA